MTAQDERPPIGGNRLTLAQLAEAFEIPLRTLERTRFVMQRGVPELCQACRDGRVSIARGEQIAKMPLNRQLAELEAELTGTKKVRGPRNIETDLCQVANLLNRLNRRWSDDDRFVAMVILRELADQLVGISPDDSGECG